jgi:hypothetical protein
MRVCYNCGAELPKRERVPFKELCPKCEAFLHCCRNCRLYDPNAPNHCKSPTTEHVPDVERGNFCDEFDFRESPEPEGRSGSRKSASGNNRSTANGRLSPREKFERLFKD